MKNILIFMVAIVVAGGSGFALQKHLNKKQAINNPLLGLKRPEFSAVDLNDKNRNIKEWDGKVILLNFWATWCPPCKKEIPDFIDLQNQYGAQGLQIIGIAIDDKEPAKDFAETIGMNYPVLVTGGDGVKLAQRYGNVAGVLPYTIIINRAGEISSTIRGELSMIRAKELLGQNGIQL
jgi:thiol-disulfide isomerase/thioredoxin